jgi:prepilin-type N-terminal cleavage/methylation domain-containing protein
MKKFLKPSGFTLVELIIVVAIIAVLATLAFMSLSGETAKARDSKRVSDIKVFEDAVSTSNGKNKRINYTEDTVGKNHDQVARNDPTSNVFDTLETNSGYLQPIRGSSLIPIVNGVFDSDVIPTAPRDPRGSYYFGAFLSATDYSFYGTAENPETKIPTAIVRGSFKEGMILDIVMANVSGSAAATEIQVANASRFVRGDIIRIDDEYMAVVGYLNDTESKLVVQRGYDPTGNNGLDTASINVHNQGAAVRLVTSAPGGESLLCLGTLAEATAETIIEASAPTTGFTTGFTLGALGTAIAGNVCTDTTSDEKGAITDGSRKLPYRVN